MTLVNSTTSAARTSWISRAFWNVNLTDRMSCPSAAPADSPSAFEPIAGPQPAPCVHSTASWAKRADRKRDAIASDEPACLWQCASSLMRHSSILGQRGVNISVFRLNQVHVGGHISLGILQYSLGILWYLLNTLVFTWDT